VRFAGGVFPQYANVNMNCHRTNGKFQFKTVLDRNPNAKYVCAMKKTAPHRAVEEQGQPTARIT
jgi:hypothetical protein